MTSTIAENVVKSNEVVITEDDFIQPDSETLRVDINLLLDKNRPALSLFTKEQCEAFLVKGAAMKQLIRSRAAPGGTVTVFGLIIKNGGEMTVEDLNISRATCLVMIIANEKKYNIETAMYLRLPPELKEELKPLCGFAAPGLQFAYKWLMTKSSAEIGAIDAAAKGKMFALAVAMDWMAYTNSKDSSGKTSSTLQFNSFIQHRSDAEKGTAAAMITNLGFTTAQQFGFGTSDDLVMKKIFGMSASPVPKGGANKKVKALIMAVLKR